MDSIGCTDKNCGYSHAKLSASELAEFKRSMAAKATEMKRRSDQPIVRPPSPEPVIRNPFEGGNALMAPMFIHADSTVTATGTTDTSHAHVELPLSAEPNLTNNLSNTNNLLGSGSSDPVLESEVQNQAATQRDADMDVGVNVERSRSHTSQDLRSLSTRQNQSRVDDDSVAGVGNDVSTDNNQPNGAQEEAGLERADDQEDDGDDEDMEAFGSFGMGLNL